MLESAAGEVQVAACPIEERTNFRRPLEQVLITPTPFTIHRAGQVSNETASWKGKEIQVAARVGGNLISLFAWACEKFLRVIGHDLTAPLWLTRFFSQIMGWRHEEHHAELELD